MDPQFWLDMGWLFLVNLATPTLFFLSPLRVAQMTVYPLQYPWLIVTVVCTAGGVIGMIPSFVFADRLAATTYGRRLLAKPMAERLRRRLERRMFALVLLGNLVFVPDVVPNIMAGLARYSFRRYLLANAVGRFLHVLPWTLAGAYAARFPTVVSMHRHVRVTVGSWASLAQQWLAADPFRAVLIVGGVVTVLTLGLARYAARLASQANGSAPQHETSHHQP